MANIRVIQSPYIGPFSNIEAVNEPSTGSGIGIHVGELGGRVELTQTGAGTKEYQKVQLDSGVAVGVGPGVVATGQLAYWKLKANYIVTNDPGQAIGATSVVNVNTPFRNEVAGVFTNAVTAGNYTWVQQKGNNTVLKSKSVTAIPGYWVVSDNTAATSQVDLVATTTAPTVQPLGKNNTSGTAQTTLNVDLDIPGIP